MTTRHAKKKMDCLGYAPSEVKETIVKGMKICPDSSALAEICPSIFLIRSENAIEKAVKELIISSYEPGSSSIGK